MTFEDHIVAIGRGVVYGVIMGFLIFMLSCHASADYTIAHISDVQLLSRDHPDQLNNTFAYLETLTAPPWNLTAIINTGDLVQVKENAREWGNYSRARNLTTVPVYDIAGNHDNDETKPSTWTYWDAFEGAGHRYYTADIRDFLFIGLSYNLTTPVNYAPFREAIDAHPDAIPLIATHAYRNKDGGYYNIGRGIQQNLITRFSLVLYGHHDGHTRLNRTYNGVPVFEEMTMYGGSYTGELYTVATRPDNTVQNITIRSFGWYTRTIGTPTVIYSAPPREPPQPPPAWTLISVHVRCPVCGNETDYAVQQLPATVRCACGYEGAVG